MYWMFNTHGSRLAPALRLPWAARGQPQQDMGGRERRDDKYLLPTGLPQAGWPALSVADDSSCLRPLHITRSVSKFWNPLPPSRLRVIPKPYSSQPWPCTTPVIFLHHPHVFINRPFIKCPSNDLIRMCHLSIAVSMQCTRVQVHTHTRVMKLHSPLLPIRPSDICDSILIVQNAHPTH